MILNKLSIIVPVYNEQDTIGEILNRLTGLDLGSVVKEIIAVSDGSTDNTNSLLKAYEARVKVIYKEKNEGKGSAMIAGINAASGDFIITQDADLEYNPEDIKKIVKAAEDNDALAVYGSRRLGLVKKKNIKAGWSYYIGGVLLTAITNLLYDTKITDEPTGYKMVSRELIKKINLKSRGFEFCPEITAKIARQGVKIFEVPISYHPRSRMEGKKIKFIDAVIAVWTLIKYRFVK